MPTGTYLPVNNGAVVLVGKFNKELDCYRVSPVTGGVSGNWAGRTVIEEIYRETKLLTLLWLKHKFDPPF